MNESSAIDPQATAALGPGRKRSTCGCRKRPATSSATPSSWN